MNKQRFLAELRRLLVFMTDEDRELTVRLYTRMFDAAGEDGEAALIAELGTPTKAAIALSRGYEPGSAPERCAEIQARWEKKRMDFAQEIAVPEVPEYRLPDELEAILTQPQEEPEPVFPEEEPDYAEPEDSGAQDVVFAPVKTPIDRPMPLALGILALILGLVAVALPLAVLLLALVLALLAPGAACVYAAGLVAIGGLWCLTYLADALLLFGGAALVLAVALLVLWGGVWCDVKLVRLYVRFVGWYAGAVLGKREA